MVKRRTLEDYEADKTNKSFNQGLEAAALLAEQWAASYKSDRTRVLLALAVAIRKLSR